MTNVKPTSRCSLSRRIRRENAKHFSRWRVRQKKESRGGERKKQKKKKRCITAQRRSPPSEVWKSNDHFPHAMRGSRSVSRFSRERETRGDGTKLTRAQPGGTGRECIILCTHRRPVRAHTCACVTTSSA